MKVYKFTILCLLFLGFQGKAQNNNENYVQTITPRVEVQNVTDLNLLLLKETSSSILYFDGLGRVHQEISQGQSPNGKDVIQPFIYDSNGNETKQYLPFATNGNAGNMVSSVIGRQQIFYNSAHRVPHTSYAYSEIKLDKSPAKNVLEKSNPGAQWNLQNGEVTKSDVVVNGSNEIINWKTGVNGELTFARYYSSGALLGSQIIDENGQKSQIFTAYSGDEILSRKELDNSWVETYSVYDNSGKLRYVIQPQATKDLLQTLESEPYTEPSEILATENFQQHLFIYEYDERNRVIRKKTPGSDWVEYYYNELDQVVLNQDGNHRLNGTYLYYKYDVYGREIMSGLLNSNVYNYSLDREVINNHIQTSAQLWETRSNQDYQGLQGYTNLSFPNLGLDILTVNYYDTYDFNYDGSNDYNFQSLSYQAISTEALALEIVSGGLSNTPDFKTVGALTGTKSKILNGPKTGTWVSSISWFDKKGREIQVLNYNYINGFSRLDNYYSFSGKVVHSNIYHTGDPDNDGNFENVHIKSRNEYDHSNRLLKSYSQFNDQTPVLMVENHYNEIGQVIESNYHSEVLGSYLQSVDFSYNPRGWLTHINNCDLENDDLFTDFEGVNYDHIKTELKTIKLNLDEVHNDGTLQIQLTIVADREVTVKEKESTNTKTVTKTDTSDQNVKTKEPDSSGNDPVYESLLALSSQNIELDLNDIEIEAGMTTAQVYAEAEQKLEGELRKFNVTDTRTKDLLKSRIGDYIVRRMGNVYFNNDDNDLWGMCIEYNTTSENFSNDPLYNGNISEIQWKNGLDNVKRAYGFKYDDLNRFKSATHKAFNNVTNSWNLELNHYNEFGLEYDANGNIQALKRNGFTNTADQFQLIDDLAYSYKGNQLSAVQDNASYENENHFDFTNGVDLVEEYIYDANGNMVEDKNKGIVSISYNHMNLPEVVLFTSGDQVEFVYDSEGIKRHKIVSTADNQANNSYYEGSFHYANSQINFIQNDYGRTVPIENGELTEYKYEYQYVDHQSNTRLIYSDLDSDGEINPQTEVLQLNDYYPFGLDHKGHSNWQQIGASNSYKFQGQESHLDFGLNWNQFKWRNHQADLGRFFNIDPLSDRAKAFKPLDIITTHLV